ncbi:MAG: hypothetical protein ACKVGZ_10355, partial [Alphaproteobacteria bacterium]
MDGLHQLISRAPKHGPRHNIWYPAINAKRRTATAMLCAVFSVMVAFVAAAQSEAAEPTAANLIAAAGFPEANLGYVVVSLADGRVKRVH